MVPFGGYKQFLDGKPSPIAANTIITILVTHMKVGYEPSIFAISFYARENEKYFISTNNYKIKDDTSIETDLQILRKVQSKKNGSINYVPITFYKRQTNDSAWIGSKPYCTDYKFQEYLRTLKG